MRNKSTDDKVDSALQCCRVAKTEPKNKGKRSPEKDAESEHWRAVFTLRWMGRKNGTQFSDFWMSDFLMFQISIIFRFPCFRIFGFSVFQILWFSDFRSLGFSIFRMLEFSNVQIFKFSDFLSVEFSEFQTLGFSDLRILGFSDFRMFGFWNFMIFKISDFRIFGFSDFQISKYSDVMTFWLSEFVIFWASDFLFFWLPDFPIFILSEFLIFWISYFRIFSFSHFQILWACDFKISKLPDFRISGFSDSCRVDPPASPDFNVEGSSSYPFLCWRTSCKTKNIDIRAARGSLGRYNQTEGWRMQESLKNWRIPAFSFHPCYWWRLVCIHTFQNDVCISMLRRGVRMKHTRKNSSERHNFFHGEVENQGLVPTHFASPMKQDRPRHERALVLFPLRITPSPVYRNERTVWWQILWHGFTNDKTILETQWPGSGPTCFASPLK